jgi:hypothetical protein
MTAHDGDGLEQPQGWIARFKQAYWPAGGSFTRGPYADPEYIIPDENRKAVMRSLDPQEIRWSVTALGLALIAGIGAPTYYVFNHVTAKPGKHVSVSVGQSALLLGGLLLLLSIGGLIAIWHRKRTLVSFDLMLTGFAITALTLLQPLGLAYLVVGGWFMLRASRINRYGTTNTKAIRTQAAARPRGRERKEAAKAASRPGARKPPAASKRYTPKAPPRKKIPKPTE